MTEDDYETVLEEHNMQSNKWKRNTSLAEEAMLAFDSTKRVVRNMKNENEGVLKMRLDYEIV